jgi:uncharacterized Zn finger protein
MGWRDDDYYGRYFPPSRPRQAKGGIKAQSKRGEFGTSWWAKRWIAVLEGFNIGARLGRGRSYARNGQVLSIQVEKGKVGATVQGSRPRPYDVTIGVKTLATADWKKVVEALCRQALFAAKLLAGEMPQDIEQVFREAGLSLFPTKLGDLKTECSCPDWSNPCKHIAAVYYLLGEEFDRDPFLIFTLRGLTREELLAQLGPAETPTEVAPAPEVALPPEPLTADVGAFWGGGDPGDEPFGEVAVPPVPAALPRRLGGFPFWRGQQPFLQAIEPDYAAASPRGLDVFLGPGAATPATSRP